MSEDTTFEKTLDELERIADSLAREDLDLDEALRLFALGVERLRTAGDLLDSAHGRVEELVEEATGSLDLRPADLGSEDSGNGEDS